MLKGTGTGCKSTGPGCESTGPGCGSTGPQMWMYQIVSGNAAGKVRDIFEKYESLRLIV
jgi:hypothetical protein